MGRFGVKVIRTDSSPLTNRFMNLSRAVRLSTQGIQHYTAAYILATVILCYCLCVSSGVLIQCWCQTSVLSVTLCYQMGACFSKVFNGCPLKIHSAASWINPNTRGMFTSGRPFTRLFLFIVTCHTRIILLQ